MRWRVDGWGPNGGSGGSGTRPKRVKNLRRFETTRTRREMDPSKRVPTTEELKV